jgi:uncharacterized protein YbjQ (UPF0145 family)
VFGGNSGTYQRKMDSMYESAQKRMKTKAKLMGGNAVVGLKTDFDEISGKGKSMFMFSATGTVCKIDNNNELPDNKTKSSYIDSTHLIEELERKKLIVKLQETAPCYLSENEWTYMFDHPTKELVKILMEKYYLDYSGERNKIESLLKNKNEEIRENENYSLKLINIIKEQKSLINTLKKEQKTLEENYSTIEDNQNTMNSLKAQINALQKKLEVKEESFLTLQKSHKILQEKYLKACSNNRKKEQEILLKQAKKLKADKIQREKDLFYEKNKKLLELKKDIMEKNYSSLNNFKPKKSPSSAYKNKKEIKSINMEEKGIKEDNNCDKSSIQLGPVLPIIKSSKNKERIERMKKKNEDDGKLEEISDMMNNILNEL